LDPQNLFLVVNEIYGRFIWKAANRYAAYTLSAKDIYQEMLLILHKEISNRRYRLDDHAKIHAIIISRSIDMFRREYRHFRHDRWERGPFDAFENRRVQNSGLDESVTDGEFRDHLLLCTVDKMDAAILCEIVWPSDKTFELAKHDAVEASTSSAGTTKVRMNCSDVINPRILKKHIAKSLGTSPARVSAALKRAAENINKLLGEKL
jgi:hypothetical protein